MKTMTTLAAVIATIATAGLATDVTTNQGTSTQQEIVHIFDAANDLRNHNDDYLPSLVDAVYQLWPTVDRQHLRGLEDSRRCGCVDR